jgi:hypothetical protein
MTKRISVVAMMAPAVSAFRGLDGARRSANRHFRAWDYRALDLLASSGWPSGRIRDGAAQETCNSRCL